MLIQPADPSRVCVSIFLWGGGKRGEEREEEGGGRRGREVVAGITVACDLSGASEGPQEIQQHSSSSSSRPRKQLLPDAFAPGGRVGGCFAEGEGVAEGWVCTHTH